MGARISKVVTRTGDKGYTSLSDGEPLRKDSPRIHCLGEIDELNAHIGLLASELEADDRLTLLQFQHDLFDLGAELSLIDKPLLNARHLAFVEEKIDEMSVALPVLQEFILPGGAPAVAQCHVTRTVCRRTERGLVRLSGREQVNPASLVYLNRLSDYFFVLARYLAVKSGQAEIYWQSSYSRIKPDC